MVRILINIHVSNIISTLSCLSCLQSPHLSTLRLQTPIIYIITPLIIAGYLFTSGFCEFEIRLFG